MAFENTLRAYAGGRREGAFIICYPIPKDEFSNIFSCFPSEPCFDLPKAFFLLAEFFFFSSSELKNK
jgi:hypothetical protein